MTVTQPDDKYMWVGAIQTFTGIGFDVINPQSSLVSVIDVAKSLSHICRYNGHVPSFYSVAEHSVRVAWWLEDRDVDPNIVLTGLLHDASEAYVGDMVRPLKRLPDLGSIHQEIEANVAVAVHHALGGVYPHPDIIHDADRAVYDWEVDFIRTGLEEGWQPDYARQHFVMAYQRLIGQVMA